jgi:hypothetical protein
MSIADACMDLTQACSDGSNDNTMGIHRQGQDGFLGSRDAAIAGTLLSLAFIRNDILMYIR